MSRDSPEGLGRKGHRPNGVYVLLRGSALLGSVLLGSVAAMAGCAASAIYYVPGCDERLGIPNKRLECRACVERPIPYAFLPDNPDGTRCVRR